VSSVLDAPPARDERGTTSIAPTVIQKIAGRAASEVRGVEAAEPSALRRFIPFVGAGAADAEVGHERAAVDLAISVRYPEPIWAKAAAVRERVVERVQELTGLRAIRVNVSVTRVAPTRSAAAKRVR
jgi:uncharacterized alkaline shock family protein YloU